MWSTSFLPETAITRTVDEVLRTARSLSEKREGALKIEALEGFIEAISHQLSAVS